MNIHASSTCMALTEHTRILRALPLSFEKWSFNRLSVVKEGEPTGSFNGLVAEPFLPFPRFPLPTGSPTRSRMDWGQAHHPPQ